MSVSRVIFIPTNSVLERHLSWRWKSLCFWKEIKITTFQRTSIMSVRKFWGGQSHTNWVTSLYFSSANEEIHRWSHLQLWSQSYHPFLPVKMAMSICRNVNNFAVTSVVRNLNWSSACIYCIFLYMLVIFTVDAMAWCTDTSWLAFLHQCNMVKLNHWDESIKDVCWC